MMRGELDNLVGNGSVPDRERDGSAAAEKREPSRGAFGGLLAGKQPRFNMNNTITLGKASQSMNRNLRNHI